MGVPRPGEPAHGSVRARRPACRGRPPRPAISGASDRACRRGPHAAWDQKIHAARVVGDRLKEKGKDRQMVCRGPDREFLAWMHKHKLEQEIPRGVLINIPNNVQKVSNELRVQSEIEVL